MATGVLLGVALQNGHFQASRDREEAPKTRVTRANSSDVRGARTVLPLTPIGDPPMAVQIWFDEMGEAQTPVLNGTLSAGREAADAYARMAKARIRGAPTGLPAAAGPAHPRALPCPATLPPETTVGAPGGRHERQHRRPG